MGGDASPKLDLSCPYALALSGGGIRSATLSLGMVQGLAVAGRLPQLRMVSTVSGGGYLGAFLKCLYLPEKLRGMGAQVDQVSAPEADFAEEVLSADADVADLNGRMNPVQWLRRHSRFLAPNGSGDYWFAGATLARNWAGMIYVFLLAIGLAMALSIWLQVGLRALLPSFGDNVATDTIARLWHNCTPFPPRTLSEPLFELGGFHATAATDAVGGALRPCDLSHPRFMWSAWFVVAGILVALGAILATAFWHTETMLTNPSERAGELKRLNKHSLGKLALLVLVTIAGVAGLWHIALSIGLIDLSATDADSVKTLGFALVLTAYIALSLMIATAFALKVLWDSRGMGNEPYPLTAKLRQRLTRWAGHMMRASLIVAAFAVVDTSAMNLYQKLNSGADLALPLSSTALASALAALIHRLASAGGESDSPLLKWIAKHLTTAALILAVILWGILAILAGTLIHAVFWRHVAWSELQLSAALLTTIALLGLAGLVIVSDGFINLSSLHSLYASRLTRAYIGATNVERAYGGSATQPRYSFNKTHPKDYLEAETYFRSNGPEHIVNIALNETVDPSTNLPERDRMATILSIGRDGIRTGGGGKAPVMAAKSELRDWDTLAGVRAERLSVGQWIAISGAAVTSGMGRMTSLGGGLLLTFANLRLGYWWRRAPAEESFSWTRLLGPFRYLHAEMTARYRRDTYRVYLSDGGHFENTGAYGILMRHGEKEYPDFPSLMLVADNGQDGRYTFSDLEQLARRARLDLGWAIEPAKPNDVASRVSAAALPHFLNRPPNPHSKADPHWRARAANPGDTGFALLIDAVKCDRSARMTIVWLKPCRVAGVSVDVAAFGESHPSFPHESTGNQFFDEEQFESYRKLGQHMIERLAKDL